MDSGKPVSLPEAVFRAITYPIRSAWEKRAGASAIVAPKTDITTAAAPEQKSSNQQPHNNFPLGG
jgi:hypothetical protein